MKFLDRNHPFFEKPLTRWISTLIPLVWGLVEVWFGNFGWGIAFLALGAWAGWELLIRK
ncbi:MAG: hypothetical protein WAT09_01860 [Paracoccaceae bacterium]